MLRAPGWFGDTAARLFARAVPRTLDRYLLAQLLPPFVIALSVVLAALLLERLLVLFNALAQDGSPLSTFVSLLADLLPHYLGLALPAALCVGVFTIVRRMSDNNEVDALLAGGVPLTRIARPFLQAGAWLGVFSVLLFGYIQPYARYDFRLAFYFASHSGWAPHLQGMMFAAPSERLMLTADDASHDGSALSHIFLRDRRQATEQDITAPRGKLSFSADRTEVRLDLWDGLILRDRGDGRPTVTHFDHTIKLISQNAHPAGFRARGVDAKEKTLGELKSFIDAQPPGSDRDHARAELHFRLARALAILFIPALAAALALMAKRRRNSPGLIIAAIVLVGFDHMLQFGQSLVATRHAHPWLMIWLPELVFAVGSTVLLLWRSGWFVGAPRSGARGAHP
nr:LptF/LptG family permease [Ameyamaea chiangmaiensis]